MELVDFTTYHFEISGQACCRIKSLNHKGVHRYLYVVPTFFIVVELFEKHKLIEASAWQKKFHTRACNQNTLMK